MVMMIKYALDHGTSQYTATTTILRNTDADTSAVTNSIKSIADFQETYKAL